jgi:hypothetical protein
MSTTSLELVLLLGLVVLWGMVLYRARLLWRQMDTLATNADRLYTELLKIQLHLARWQTVLAMREELCQHRENQLQLWAAANGVEFTLDSVEDVKRKLN